MDSQDNEENVAEFLCCASVLEMKVSSLYKKLAEKVEAPLAKSLLLYIAHDSLKHSTVLKGISENFGKPKNAKDCEKNLGQTWKTVVSFLEEIAKYDKMSADEFRSLADRLAVLESTLSEEYYILVQLKTLQYMAKQIYSNYGVDLENLRDIFEMIIQDEENHRELVMTARKILVKRKDEIHIVDNTPAVRYQNPNSW